MTTPAPNENPGRLSYSCRNCGAAISPLARTCETCDSPNPPNRHLRVAVAPIMAVLRWAQRRTSTATRVAATVLGAAILIYPFGPLIVSWWIIVAFWWLFAAGGSSFRTFMLVGFPITSVGFIVLQESVEEDCTDLGHLGRCMGEAVGLFDGTPTTAGAIGNLLLLTGLAVMMFAAFRVRRSE